MTKNQMWPWLLVLTLGCTGATEEPKEDTDFEDTDVTEPDPTPSDTDAPADTESPADTEAPTDTDTTDTEEPSDTETPVDTDVADTDPVDTDPVDTDAVTDDRDGDGFTEAEGDCNDDPAAGGAGVFPGNTEIASDGIDQDCNGLLATVDVSCHTIDIDGTAGPDPVTGVRIMGVWWNGWDPNAGPVALDNGDGTWSVLFEDAPTADMQFKWVLNGTGDAQEDLIDDMVDGESCAPVTDYSSYANRQWVVGTGDISSVFGRCTPCP